MKTELYLDCLIAVDVEGHTHVIDVPGSLAGWFCNTSARLDDWWEDCFAVMNKLQSGVYFCSIQAEFREDPDEPPVITVRDIIQANVFRAVCRWEVHVVEQSQKPELAGG